MSGRVPLLVAASCGTGLVVAVLVRRRRRAAEHLARRTTGDHPAVRADDGVLLHVEQEGTTRAGVTVVLVHGFSASPRELDPQRQGLRARARTVSYDQRGHGRSGWSGRRGGTLDQLGRDLGRVVDAVAPSGPVVLVGHSMGAMAVLALARRRPELFGGRVRAVGLLSAAGGGLGEALLPWVVARAARCPGVLRGYLGLLWALAPLVRRTHLLRTRCARRRLRRGLFAPGARHPQRLARQHELFVDTPAGVQAALYRSLVRFDARPALSTLSRVPVLVLTGSEDATIPPEHSQVMAERIGPSAELVVVPGAGHMVNATHAAAVDDALHRLLDRAGVPARSPREEGTR